MDRSGGDSYLLSEDLVSLPTIHSMEVGQVWKVISEIGYHPASRAKREIFCSVYFMSCLKPEDKFIIDYVNSPWVRILFSTGDIGVISDTNIVLNCVLL